MKKSIILVSNPQFYTTLQRNLSYAHTPKEIWTFPAGKYVNLKDVIYFGFNSGSKISKDA